MKRILVVLCGRQRMGPGDGADQRQRARSEWRGIAGCGSHGDTNRYGYQPKHNHE